MSARRAAAQAGVMTVARASRLGPSAAAAAAAAPPVVGMAAPLPGLGRPELASEVPPPGCGRGPGWPGSS